MNWITGEIQYHANSFPLILTPTHAFSSALAFYELFLLLLNWRVYQYQPIILIRPALCLCRPAVAATASVGLEESIEMKFDLWKELLLAARSSDFTLYLAVTRASITRQLI